MIFRKSAAAFLAVGALFAVSACAEQSTADSSLEGRELCFTPARAKQSMDDRLVIETQSGVHHEFHIELAQTPEQKSQGLMFRKELPENDGMLFVNDDDQPMAMWMKNTLIPLDMIFIAADGRIVNVQADAQPGDLRPRPALKPVRAALEINGGMAAKLGVEMGDYIRYPLFEK